MKDTAIACSMVELVHWFMELPATLMSDPTSPFAQEYEKEEHRDIKALLRQFRDLIMQSEAHHAQNIPKIGFDFTFGETPEKIHKYFLYPYALPMILQSVTFRKENFKILQGNELQIFFL